MPQNEAPPVKSDQIIDTLCHESPRWVITFSRTADPAHVEMTIAVKRDDNDKRRAHMDTVRMVRTREDIINGIQDALTRHTV